MSSHPCRLHGTTFLAADVDEGALKLKVDNHLGIGEAAVAPLLLCQADVKYDIVFPHDSTLLKKRVP